MISLRTLCEPEKCGVLIHGRHLQAIGWEEIEFGDMSPENEALGQVPRGLEIARDLGLDLVVFGTGASQKQGILEADYILAEALRLAEPITVYLNSKLGTEAQFADAEDFRRWLRRVSVTETTCQNTAQEIDFCSKIFMVRGKSVIYQVSCPSHLARCLVDWIGYRGRTKTQMIYVPVPSDTYFKGAGPGDIVIVEYPHRGDAPLYATYRYVKKIFGVYGQGEKKVIGFLEDFGKLLESYGIDMSGIKPLIDAP